MNSVIDDKQRKDLLDNALEETRAWLQEQLLAQNTAGDRGDVSETIENNPVKYEEEKTPNVLSSAEVSREFAEFVDLIKEYRPIYKRAKVGKDRIDELNAMLTDRQTTLAGRGNQNLLPNVRLEISAIQQHPDVKEAVDAAGLIENDLEKLIPYLLENKSDRARVEYEIRLHEDDPNSGIQDDSLRENLLNMILLALLKKRGLGADPAKTQIAEKMDKEDKIVPDIVAKREPIAVDPAPIIPGKTIVDGNAEIQVNDVNPVGEIGESGNGVQRELADSNGTENRTPKTEDRRQNTENSGQPIEEINPDTESSDQLTVDSVQPSIPTEVIPKAQPEITQQKEAVKDDTLTVDVPEAQPAQQTIPAAAPKDLAAAEAKVAEASREETPEFDFTHNMYSFFNQAVKQDNFATSDQYSGAADVSVKRADETADQAEIPEQSATPIQPLPPAQPPASQEQLNKAA